MPVPSAPTVTAAARTDAAGVLDVEEWRRVLALLSDTRPDLVAFLKHAVVLKLTPEVFTLGCESGHALEATLRSPECEKELRSAALKILGREPKVLFQAVPAGAETLADIDRRVREKQRKAAIDRAEQHPSVRSAAEILGARVKRVELGEN